MDSFRSLLFVPAVRSDRFEKAINAGADAVCIDMEDAVAPHLKQQAREKALPFLAQIESNTKTSIGIRINPLNDRQGFRDIIALIDSGAKPAFIMIPKAAGGEELVQIKSVLGETAPALWPLVEDAQGLYNLADIAKAVGEEGGIMLGGADYSASIGSDMGWDALLQIRQSIIAAASLHGCATMDVPYLDVKDDEGLRAETIRVKALGMTGRACIHPNQVSIINEIFTPTEEELSAAEKIRAAYKEAKGGVALLDGKLIEKPVLRAAERIIACKKD